MKYFFEKILLMCDNLFLVHDEIGWVIDCVFYVYLEYELIYVMLSFGTRFVGDNISMFDAGDLALIGPMLPHHYYNSPADSCSERWGHARVVQFREDFAGNDLFQLPELRPVRKLLDTAAMGITFPPVVAMAAAPLLQQLIEASGVRRITLLLEILDLLAGSEYRTLSFTVAGSYPHEPDEKINRVLQYVHQAAEQNLPLSLEKAARVACMTPPAFSRYFHRATRRKFIDYVNEIKIGKAARLLINGNQTAAAVCFDSGFNNLANFNRHFIKFKGMTPGEFRRLHRRHQPRTEENAR
jgi:AraC-like DNA-binding protein